MSDQVKQDSLSEIISLLTDDPPDYYKICDLMYHYDKSFGVTLIAIRKQISQLHASKQYFAINSFRQAIAMFKSPNFILDFQNELDDLV